jgi:hypothetical protein
MSKGTELVTLLNDNLSLEMDPLAIDFMGARFDKAFFDQGLNVDNLGAQLYLTSWDDTITTTDIQTVKDDNPEAFDATEDAFSVTLTETLEEQNEGVEIAAGTEIATVETDADSPSFALSGDDAGLFTITDNGNGTATITAAAAYTPDYDTDSSLDYTVEVTSDGDTVSEAGAVEIIDLLDPEDATYTITAASTGVTEGDSLTFTVEADGALSEETVINYQIQGVEVAGGTAYSSSRLRCIKRYCNCACW